MSAESIAQKWQDQLLRSDPIDHDSAESAVRAAYLLAGMAEPRRFLWCTSPMEAAWAVLVLVAKTEGYNHAVFEDIDRSKSGKEKIARARASVAGQLGIGEDEVEGYFGLPFFRAEGSNPVSKLLAQQSIDAWMARAEAGDNFIAIHQRGPFKPLHDLESALLYEAYRFRDGAQRPAIIREAMAKAGGKHIEILGGRSAYHRLYGNLAYSEIAVHEALAGDGKFQPTELQQAMWVAFEVCGMWWPCEEGVVFAERPVAVELDRDEPAMRWADGFGFGEINGRLAAESAPPAKPQPGGADSRDASVLEVALRGSAASRIAELRKVGQLPLLDRYVAGEHGTVWAELNALGEAVRGKAHAADALAVAYETMDRVLQNVRLLAERLKQMGYRFVEPGSAGGLFRLGKARAHKPHVPPTSDAGDRVVELENTVGGPIPLSLRAFFELVGEVNFNGDHEMLAPKGSGIAPDPLMVLGIEDSIACIESDDEDDEPKPLDLAPDALHKANVSGGDPYSIMLPAPFADAPLEGEPHGVSFVEYLRIAILGWGGFPGWEEADGPMPPDLARLREGLIPF